MRRRNKLIAALSIAAVMVPLITGCQNSKTNDDSAANKTAETDVSTDDTADGDDAATEKQDEMIYKSNDGYQVRYDPEAIESHETDDHTADFVYIADPSGNDKLTISYVSGKQPEELLFEVTESWGDQEKISRSEGFFPGTDDKWGYWRTISAADSNTGLNECAIAGEYNGGVLMFEITSEPVNEDENTSAVSDTLSSVIDSITYDDFKDQTMYDYLIGTYNSEDNNNYSVTLKKDHNADLKLDKELSALWGTIELFGADFSYNYNVEGDTLYLEYDTGQLVFDKADLNESLGDIPLNK